MVDLGQRHIMAIINVTPDSFFGGSRTSSREAIERRVRGAIEAGATILDIGGYSSRPGAADVALEEEWRRVDLGCEVVRSISADVTISVDTFRAEVVRRVVARWGDVVVNDITAGYGDSDMFGVVAQLALPYIAMHMRGTPETMQSLSDYESVVAEVVEYFRERMERMEEAGISRDRVILDVGFGFAKSVEQNYELLAALPEFLQFGVPLLVGVSRKSMIYKVLGVEPQEALAGTIALNWEALRQGATILRVHDTREAADALRIFEKYEESFKI